MAFNAGDVEATLTLDRSPFQRGLREARAEANAFERKKIRATLEVDSKGIDKINKDMERLSKARKGIKLNVNVDKGDVDQIKTVLEQIGDNTETTARRSGSRLARALLNPIVIQLGLLPGIAAAAAVAGGAALGLLAVGFGAVAVAALKNNEDLKTSWKDLWTFIKDDTAALASPLIGTFQSITDDIRQSWQAIRPDMQQLFKDIDPLIQSVTSGLLGFAEEAIPGVQNALALAGPTMRGFDLMLRSIGGGFGEMSENIAAESIAMGDGLDYFGQLARNLFSDLGRLIGMFSVAWADIGPQFVATFDRMIDAVLTFTQGGLTGLTTGLNLTLGVLNAIMTVLGPFLSMFGGLAGLALSAAASWKILSGAVGLFAKAINLIRPAQVAAGLAGLGAAMDNIGVRAGRAATGMGASEGASKRLASTTSKVGSAMVTAGSYLPVFGLAVGAVALAQQAAAQSAEELAQKLLEGGAAAVTAQAQINGLRDMADRADDSFMGWALNLVGITDRMRGQADAAEESYRAQRDGMTAVEFAQIRATAAQAAYDTAVRKHGVNSFEAKNAQLELAGATDVLEQAQHDAATAVQSVNDKLIQQTNLMLASIGAGLSYDASLQSLETSQKNLNEAVRQHGGRSLEARTASNQYQQSLLAVVNAAGKRAEAEAEAAGVVDTAKAANIGARNEIIRLAVAAGTNAPAALQKMIAGFTDSELAAYGVERQVTKTGTSVRLVPGRKSINFQTNASTTKGQVDGLRGSVNSVPKSNYITFYLSTIGSVPKAPIESGGLGMVGRPPRRARGGPVKANSPYWVGDGGLPELFWPKVDGFVLNGRDSMRLAQGRGVTQGVSHPPLANGGVGMDPGQLADALATAMAAIFGDGLRLSVDGSGVAKLVNEQNLAGARR